MSPPTRSRPRVRSALASWTALLALLAAGPAVAGGDERAASALALHGVRTGLILIEQPIRRLVPTGRWVMPSEFVVRVPFTDDWQLVPQGFDADPFPRQDPWETETTPALGVGFRF